MLEAKLDFSFAFYSKTKALIVFLSYFQGAYFVTPISILNKYTREVRINVIAKTEKVKFYGVITLR